MSTDNVISWDRQKVDRLKKRYRSAVQAHEAQFKFEDWDFLTQYAKYLIEYLDVRLGSDDRRPGIIALMDDVRDKHPAWSEARVCAEAKSLWHERHKT